ncbi:MAG: NADH-quinone oxidoreductase subunit D [bacterium]|nr:NADH-quinone oxidoreductase subunit D [bacterium]
MRIQQLDSEKNSSSDNTQPRTEEYLINMGPQHPSTHGVLRLVLRLAGETVLEVTPHLGYIHRSIEKICENETYTQITHLTDRLDYLCAHTNNWCWIDCVERAMGLELPDRAQVIRVLMAELQRIQSHLLWWGVFGMDLGAFTPFLYGFRDREKITDIFEETCGARLTMNYFRIGGVVWDLHENFIPRVNELLTTFPALIDEYERLLSKNVIIQSRCQGVGILSPENALAYGCSGPVIRGSGLARDVRKDAPYGIYDRFSFDVPTGTTGDCFDRYQVRIEEMRESLKIIDQAIKMLEPGDFTATIPRKIKLPEGAHYSLMETARGAFGCYLYSDGKSDKPVRVKLTSPSYNNLQAVNCMARNLKIADLVTIVSTLDLVIPDIDR